MRPALISLVFTLTLMGCGSAAVVPTATPIPPTETPVPPTPDPCSSEVLRAFGAEARPLMRTYMDQLEIARNMPRIGLGPVLQALFDAEQEIVNLTPPPCAETWHIQTKRMMRLYRDSMNDFAAQRETEAKETWQRADAVRRDVYPALLRMAVGNPPALD